MLAASGLQMTLPPWLAFGPHWLLPALEIGLRLPWWRRAPVGSNAGRPAGRRPALAWVAEPTSGPSPSCWSATWPAGPRSLALLPLACGALWTANVLIFALWYWELDRGGPADRCHAVRLLRLPADAAARLGPTGLDACFTDYLYLSFTNAISLAATWPR